MRDRLFLRCASPTVVLLLVAGGCLSQDSAQLASPESLTGPPPSIAPVFIAHHHLTENLGPHGGQVIEVGRNHSFHAELVIDEQTGSIRVYILDGELQELEIEQEKLTLSLSGVKLPKSVELAAVRQGNGLSCQFTTTDHQFLAALRQEKATGKLHVIIDGRPYVGYIEARLSPGHDYGHVH